MACPEPVEGLNPNGNWYIIGPDQNLKMLGTELALLNLKVLGTELARFA